MRKILFIGSFLLVLVTSLYSQKIEFSDFDLRANLPDWIITKTDNVNIKENLIVNRDLNPFYLESDFNGDHHLDIALFVTNKDSNKRGILIIHGKTLKSFLIGADNPFGNNNDDYKWLKVWKVYRDNIAYKTTFTEDLDVLGSEEVELKNIAISVAPSEGTYNLIMWNGEEYEWIHTGD